MNHLYCFYNTAFISQNPLENAGNFLLQPVRYLFLGKEVCIYNDNAIQISNSFDKRNYLRAALAIAAIAPGIIFGTLLKAISFLTQDIRKRHYQLEQHFRKGGSNPSAQGLLSSSDGSSSQLKYTDLSSSVQTDDTLLFEDCESNPTLFKSLPNDVQARLLTPKLELLKADTDLYGASYKKLPSWLRDDPEFATQAFQANWRVAIQFSDTLLTRIGEELFAKATPKEWMIICYRNSQVLKFCPEALRNNAFFVAFAHHVPGGRLDGNKLNAFRLLIESSRAPFNILERICSVLGSRNCAASLLANLALTNLIEKYLEDIDVNEEDLGFRFKNKFKQYLGEIKEQFNTSLKALVDDLTAKKEPVLAELNAQIEEAVRILSTLAMGPNEDLEPERLKTRLKSLVREALLTFLEETQVEQLLKD